MKLTSGLGSEIVNLFSVVKTWQKVVLLHLFLLLLLCFLGTHNAAKCCVCFPVKTSNWILAFPILGLGLG